MTIAFKVTRTHRVWKTAVPILSAFLFLGLIANLQAATFYLDPAGSDSNSGTIGQPWQSIGKVNATSLNPGDAVYFQGGQTFFGNLVLKGQGSDITPVIIGSYGTGRASINAGTNVGIYGYNTGGFRIENLNLEAPMTSNTSAGISFFTDDTAGTKFPGIALDQVTVHGFGDTGINVGSWQQSEPGWTQIQATGVKSFENAEGMSIYGYTTVGVTAYSIGSISIDHCEFSENISSGLVLCGASSGQVSYCTFHHNKSIGGCWTWGTAGVVIEHCISHHNLKGDGTDGFGFDLDGGTSGCIVQYWHFVN